MKVELRLISDDGALIHGLTWDAFEDRHTEFNPPFHPFSQELWKGDLCLTGCSYEPHLLSRIRRQTEQVANP